MGSVFPIIEDVTSVAPLLPSQTVADQGEFDFTDSAGEEGAAGAPPSPEWGDIVTRVSAGDPTGLEDLYGIFGKGVRWMFLRQLGAEELEDRVHDCFIIVAQAIQGGELREPERLMGYVRTIVKRQIAMHIDGMVHRRRTQADFEDAMPGLSDVSDDPEQVLWEQQRAEIARRVLKGIPKRDREILRRFYVEEQSQDQICTEMNLSYNQFRLMKSRAKKRFGEMGKRLALGLGRRLGGK